MLVFVKMQVAFGLLIFGAQDAVRRSELGHDESASAKIADEAAEYGVGDASHGGKHRRRGDGKWADLEFVRKAQECYNLLF